MKVRFGDLKFRNGRTMEEAARYCTMAGDCKSCEYRTEIECMLIPDFRDIEKNVSNIMNYEMEIPQADHYGQWIHEQHEFGFDGNGNYVNDQKLFDELMWYFTEYRSRLDEKRTGVESEVEA